MVPRVRPGQAKPLLKLVYLDAARRKCSWLAAISGRTPPIGALLAQFLSIPTGSELRLRSSRSKRALAASGQRSRLPRCPRGAQENNEVLVGPGRRWLPGGFGRFAYSE